MGYQSIITIVTEQSASTIVARYAIALAAATRARLILYAAHGTERTGPLLHQTEHHLDHLFTAACAQDLAVSRIAESGNLTEVLPERLRTEQADLVFYPLPPEDRYGDPWQRHAVHWLLRTLPTDLAVMRIVQMGKPHPRQILVPIGESSSDVKSRLHFVSALATAFAAGVALFHRPSGLGEKTLSAGIADFRHTLQQHQVAVRELSRTRHIGRAIIEEAIAHHHDLIVLGASERGLVRRLLFGHPAGQVMQQPPCNALLFRATADQP